MNIRFCPSLTNTRQTDLQLVVQGLSKALLFLAMNMAGLFIHYLSDRTQRQSFLETRRCIEGRVRLERENHRQVESTTCGMLVKFYILFTAPDIRIVITIWPPGAPGDVHPASVSGSGDDW